MCKLSQKSSLTKVVAIIIHFLGCGSAFNPLLGNTSAYFVSDEKLFLIDAGETVFSKLYAMGLLEKYDDINIIITHTHADHIGSLSSIISYTYYVLKKKVKVLYPEKSLIRLLELMGIEAAAYEISFDKEHCIGNVKLQAIDVKHAEDIKCYGYILEFPNQKIYYSGDAYEVPDIVVKNFYAGEIDRIYQDTTEFVSAHLSHCPLSVLEGLFPREKRENVYCMHFSNDFYEKIVDKGFNYVRVDE